MHIQLTEPTKIPVDCHHPEYQPVAVNTNSWWCDECINQCSQLARYRDRHNEHEANEGRSILNVFDNLAGEWLTIWDWFRPILIASAGCILSAMFALVAYLGQHPIWEQDEFSKKEKQYKWLNVGRERALMGIDREKDRLAKYLFVGDFEKADDCQWSIRNLQRYVEKKTAMIESMEDEFFKRRKEEQAKAFNKTGYWSFSDHLRQNNG